MNLNTHTHANRRQASFPFSWPFLLHWLRLSLHLYHCDLSAQCVSGRAVWILIAWAWSWGLEEKLYELNMELKLQSFPPSSSVRCASYQKIKHQPLRLKENWLMRPNYNNTINIYNLLRMSRTTRWEKHQPGQKCEERERGIVWIIVLGNLHLGMQLKIFSVYLFFFDDALKYKNVL